MSVDLRYYTDKFQSAELIEGSQVVEIRARPGQSRKDKIIRLRLRDCVKLKAAIENAIDGSMP